MLLNGFLFGLQTLCWKIFSQKYLKNRSSYFLFNTLYFIVCIVTFLIFFGLNFEFRMITWVFGICFGVLFVVTTLLYIKSMETGPLSYATLLFSFGIIIPVFVGIQFWGEKVSFFRAIGLILLLLVIMLASRQEVGKNRKHVNLKWILFAIFSFLGNGSLMVLMKAHQRMLPGMNVKEFLIISFSTAMLISLISFFFSAHRSQNPVSHFRGITPVVLGAGLTTAFGNILAVMLASKVPSVIQFPTVCLGTIVVSTFFSCLIFKEKMNIYKASVLTTGIVALFFINL